MAKWQDKEIKLLTDVELQLAHWSLSNMKNDYEEKQNDPRFAKKFKNQPLPEINPSFIALLEEVTTELKNRKL